MAKIDKIQVGTDSYDINLPTTATPEISSLTVTGNLTVSGTSNLSKINSFMDRAGTIAYFDTIAPNTISFAGQTLTLTGTSLSINVTDNIDIKASPIQAEANIYPKANDSYSLGSLSKN